MINKTKPRPAPRGAARAATKAPSRGRPKFFWYVVPAVTLVIGGLLGAWIGAVVADPRSDTQQRIDEMQAADNRRDADQVVSLTGQARRVSDMLGTVLEGLHTALPPGNTTPGPLAPTAQVDGWKAVTRKAVDEFADSPSAGTSVNIARGSIAAGARQLDLAVATYAAALKAPDDQRPALLAAAAQQRDNAIATWSVGATELDVLNIDTGHGHQHVFLPSAPGQGAMTADGEEEGK